MTWKVGDYTPIEYSDGSTGWGRLEHGVTEGDLPLASGAEPGDFIWRILGATSRQLHQQPLKPSELGARPPQDRLLWAVFPYQNARMIVLDDLQYVALHAALKVQEHLVSAYDQADLDAVKAKERAEAAHKERQAKNEAAKRLGGRDTTRTRRGTQDELKAKAAREQAGKAVEAARWETCGIIGCQLPTGDDAPSYWDRRAIWAALERHPIWRRQYTLASSSGMEPLPKSRRGRNEAHMVERAESERTDGLKGALRAPPPPRKACECCGQQHGADPLGTPDQDVPQHRRRTA